MALTFSLLYAIRIEKTVKLTDFEGMFAASKSSPAETRSNNSYTLLRNAYGVSGIYYTRQD